MTQLPVADSKSQGAEERLQPGMDGSRVEKGEAMAKDKKNGKLKGKDYAEKLSAGDKEKIFQKYETTGRRAVGQETGSGIGLAFCTAAAHAMKGRVWVEDRPGGGSRFILEFPFQLA